MEFCKWFAEGARAQAGREDPDQRALGPGSGGPPRRAGELSAGSPMPAPHLGGAGTRALGRPRGTNSPQRGIQLCSAHQPTLQDGWLEALGDLGTGMPPGDAETPGHRGRAMPRGRASQLREQPAWSLPARGSSLPGPGQHLRWSGAPLLPLCALQRAELDPGSQRAAQKLQSPPPCGFRNMSLRPWWGVGSNCMYGTICGAVPGQMGTPDPRPSGHRAVVHVCMVSACGDMRRCAPLS